ncbi:hypothetical protein RHSIM_Rhsim12G0132400 [Rhododendron simsii]|uniref:RRM domain-containing protein n=1 Tax=Rhododendron simsii TaxID=118357 RepID=A0A834L8L0_RHOSS|nr:hypothetical protein RHSIM_Rhsim12G0132400 [Rhododendron simsii]
MERRQGSHQWRMDYRQSQSSGGKTTVIHALRVVDNLPENASHDWLTRMFNDYGVVKEVFIIPAKRSRASGNKLGLVRYDCHVSADIAILRHGLKRREIRFVMVASFGQEENYKRQQRNTTNQALTEVAKPHNKLTMEELKEELVLEGLSNMDFRSIGGGEAAILECKDG